MARIILGSYVIRFPLGGYLSWVLQWMVGFKRLGHEVYFVEKAGWANACFDPSKNRSSDDCVYGTQTWNSLLSRFGLQDCWCFVDFAGRYHGLSRERLKDVFRSSDAFIDMGTHGAWMEDAADAKLRVLVDGEPAATQMKMENQIADGEMLPDYDVYYTVGRNIGTNRCTAPTAGKRWRTVVYPVNLDLYPSRPVEKDAPFTTVMSWQAHDPVEFDRKSYGQKDVEFLKFMGIPSRTESPLEIAVAGKNVPYDALKRSGWRVRSAHEVSKTFDAFNAYIASSRGEFSVCKNVFVATRSGWFSDRSAIYLASGRPVVMQDTGFSDHLPCGSGLFAVRTPEDAVIAFDEIQSRYEHHSKSAREIASQYLDATKVLGRFLSELGL